MAKIKLFLLHDMLFTIFLIAFIFRFFGGHNLVYLFDSLFIFYLGMSWIMSFKYMDNSIVEKTLFWISKNIFWPRTKYNHIALGIIVIFLSIANLLSIEEQKSGLLWQDIFKDKKEIFLIVLILFLLIIMGFYRQKISRRHRRL